jgi:Flp pilus assembly CpaE family ATPase
MRVPFLGALPFDPAVVEGGDAGRPVIEEEGDSPFKKAVEEFTMTVLKRLSRTGDIGKPAEKTIH